MNVSSHMSTQRTYFQHNMRYWILFNEIEFSSPTQIHAPFEIQENTSTNWIHFCFYIWRTICKIFAYVSVQCTLFGIHKMFGTMNCMKDNIFKICQKVNNADSYYSDSKLFRLKWNGMKFSQIFSIEEFKNKTNIRGNIP